MQLILSYDIPRPSIIQKRLIVCKTTARISILHIEHVYWWWKWKGFSIGNCKCPKSLINSSLTTNKPFIPFFILFLFLYLLSFYIVWLIACLCESLLSSIQVHDAFGNAAFDGGGAGLDAWVGNIIFIILILLPCISPSKVYLWKNRIIFIQTVTKLWCKNIFLVFSP